MKAEKSRVSGYDKAEPIESGMTQWSRRRFGELCIYSFLLEINIFLIVIREVEHEIPSIKVQSCPSDRDEMILSHLENTFISSILRSRCIAQSSTISAANPSISTVHYFRLPKQHALRNLYNSV